MRLRAGLCLLGAAAGLILGAPGAPAMSNDTPEPQSANASGRISVPPHDLDTPRTFPAFHTLAEWKTRKAHIRQHLQVALGLYPLPPKPPLKAQIFDRVERDGYTIEKVTFQTHPGFYLAGNLYRPLRKNGKSGKVPGVLVAHGHWGNGRMANEPGGSISARAITFARQGYVAFTYDMVGYNDTRQINHQFANTARHWLWGVSLMGLQTWNSLRALDFLCSLPEVDKSRLAITGESGGGTQTMMLGALDDRLTAVGPCVMVSHTMQGGCLCENAPGLRVDFSNVEIAAAAAPKVQVIVGASGDWTSTTMTMEGPSVATIYDLYGRRDRLNYVLFNYGHNINQTSREAVYAFFGDKLLGEKDAAKLKEPPYTMEPVASLRVFPDDKPMPPDAKSAEALTDYLIQIGKDRVERRKPEDRRGLTEFKKVFLPFWQQTLNVELTKHVEARFDVAPASETSGYVVQKGQIGRANRPDNIPVTLFVPATPEGQKSKRTVVLVHSEGRAPLLDATGQPGSLARALLGKGIRVLLVEAFLTGAQADPNIAKARHVPFGKYFSTYNRTDMQERVQDLITACAFAREQGRGQKVTLVGLGQAGLWALLAAPAADAVAADAAQTDLTTDDALLTDALFVPGLRRMGDFQPAAVLAAPNRLLLHNTGTKFPAAVWVKDVYTAVGASDKLRVEQNALSEDALTQWLSQ